MPRSGNVTTEQIPHQLLLNDKTPHSVRQRKTKLTGKNTSYNYFTKPFSIDELKSGINNLKNGKAIGLDNVFTHQLKHFGPKALNWLLHLFNIGLASMKIPKIWRKSGVIALLKPGKDPALTKSYRPISLLRHTFQLLERLLLSRLYPFVEDHLISQQAGFRPGKSTTGQLLNLTQHNEDGYQERKIIGAVFVNLTAADDTVNVNLCRLLSKVLNMTNDSGLTEFWGLLLKNRRFFVEFNNKKAEFDCSAMAYHKEVCLRRYYMTSTPIISHRMKKPSNSYMLMIYVSPAKVTSSNK